MHKLSSSLGLIQKTVEVFRRQANIMLGIGALVAIPTLMADFAINNAPTQSWWNLTLFGGVVGIAMALWSSLISTGMYAKITQPDAAQTIDDAIRTGMKRWGAYWTTTLLQWLYVIIPTFVVVVGIGIVVGSTIAHPGTLFDLHALQSTIETHGTLLLSSLALLGLAAIVASYYSLKFLFSGYLVFKEGIRNRVALRRSDELTTARLWDLAGKLFIFSLFIGLISIAIGIVDGIVISPITNPNFSALIDQLFQWLQWMITLPLGLIFIANLYQDIIRANSAPTV